jgi:hypothetical protein
MRFSKNVTQFSILNFFRFQIIVISYFSGEDMKKIFSLRVDGVCETMEILNSVHPHRYKEQQVGWAQSALSKLCR